MAQDTQIFPWGAMDRFQAHYVVYTKSSLGDADCVANTVITTSGRFGDKKLVGVSWQGAGKLAKVLNSDSELNSMIVSRGLDDSIIFVDSVDDAVRIYARWKNNLNFSITKEEYEIVNRIAGHIKTL